MNSYKGSDKTNLTLFPQTNPNKRDDIAYVKIDNQSFELSSIIVAGRLIDQNRSICTWNCTTDELAGHLKGLELAIKRVLAAES